jgi:hypothetical protein
MMVEKKINQENRQLLLKLAGTVQTTEIDNKCPHRLAKGASVKKKEVAKRELYERDVANQKMLERILSAKKTFSAHKWEEEEKQRQKLLLSMSEFPPVPVAVQSNISGDGWGKSCAHISSSRPVTAKTRRENAWNSNTTEVHIRDSNELLHVSYDTPTPERVKQVQRYRRPKTANSSTRKTTSTSLCSAITSVRGGGATAAATATAGGRGERISTFGSGYGNSLGRNRPGYSNDPLDRDFDVQYKELFATAREEYTTSCLLTARGGGGTKKQINNFM